MERLPPAIRSAAALAFAADCLVVLILSLLPGSEALDFNVSDKAQHLGAYAGLGALGTFAFRRPGRSSTLPLLAFLVAFGVCLEVGQAFSPGRSPEIADAVANSLGAGLGVLLSRSALVPLYLLWARRGRRLHP